MGYALATLFLATTPLRGAKRGAENAMMMYEGACYGEAGEEEEEGVGGWMRRNEPAESFALINAFRPPEMRASHPILPSTPTEARASNTWP